MLAQTENTPRMWLAKGFLIVAGILLLISLLFPYWRVDLQAGIYPKGLSLQIRPYRLEGDVAEIDELNHYIGMRRLQSAGQLERKIAIPSIAIAALCLLISAFVPRKWSIWFALPGLVFPIIFVGELYWWLRSSGLDLDPKAPLNQSIKPFIPSIYGEGRIAQFSANASFQIGFFLTLLAALLARIAIYLKKSEWLVKGLIIDASILLLISLLFPYWRVDFDAKKYPKGLILQIHPQRLDGNIREIDKLNEDIGMRKLESAGGFERKIAVPSIAIAGLCLLLSVFVRRKWSRWFALPGLIFPIIFVGELYWWLRQSGLNLDPELALYPSIEPFIPPIIGQEKVGSVTTTSTFQIGFYFAILTTLLTGVALFLKKWGLMDVKKPITAIFLIPLTFLMTSTSTADTLIVDQNSSIGETLASVGDGDTIIVRGGVHHERFVVDKSVTLLGEDEPIIDGGGEGHVIEFLAPKIVFRGFTIRNSGDRISEGDAGIMTKKAADAIIEENKFEDVLYGVQVRNSPGTIVRNNTFRCKELDVPRRGDLIRVWYSSGAVVENNRVSDGRDVVIWYSKKVIVRGNEVRNGRYGIHFMYCDDATIEGNRLIGNSVGIYLMYSYRLRLQRNWVTGSRGASGYGIGQKDMYDGLVADNFIADNRAGMFLDNATGDIRGNLIAFNDFGGLIFPSARKNMFAENSFVDNGEQVAIEGQGSIGDNKWQGNYWSDYSGYDADGDGVGDIPYQSMRLFERLTEQRPALRLFTYSPSVQALDLASRLFPIFAPQPKLVDDTPRMRPTMPPLTAPIRRLSSAWILGSTALLLFAMTLSGRLAFFSHNRAKRKEGEKSEIIHNATDAAISMCNITKRFGKIVAVDNLSFDVATGETVALWGPNGAGKTTALRCLLGILPSEGEITVCGKSTYTEGKAVRQQIGYVPQEVRLHSDLTVRETISFYARLRAVSTERVEMLMDEWQLSEIAGKSIGNLSGGMKQRLALAVALLSNPPILLLDEPTSNLDAKTRHEFCTALERLKKAGKTLIFCSHRVDEIFRLADRVIVMESGKKVADGPPASLNGYLPWDARLHLTIPKSLHETAENLLEQHGLSVQRNGTRISVQTPPNRKADPFRILIESAIPVLDFDLGDSQERSDG